MLKYIFSILLYLVSSIEVSFFGAQQMVDALIVVTAWDMFMVIYGLQMFWQAKALSLFFCLFFCLFVFLFVCFLLLLTPHP